MKKRRDDWFVKAGQAWDVLIQVAARRELTTYKGVGSIIGVHHRAMRYPLGVIQSYCIEERLPVLAAIVVNAEQGRPGGGSVAAGRPDLDEVQAEIFNYPWATHPNPFTHFAPGEDLDTLTGEIVSDPDKAGDIYGRVRVRGIAQQIFRTAVSRAYGWQCAICGLSFLNALEAAHIVRWVNATPQQRLDPRNGLLLCANHHKLFDASLITVTGDYRVKYYDPDITQDPPYTDADLQISVEQHGKMLNLPADKRHWPEIEWLRQRNTADGWDE